MPNQVKYKIRELRKKNGDTLKKLAEKINYDYSNLSKIERGLEKPSISLLKKIANVYDVQISNFCDHNTSTSEDTSFMESIDISSKELFKKYHFVLDGKRLSEQELGLTLEIIRELRMAIIDEQQREN